MKNWPIGGVFLYDIITTLCGMALDGCVGELKAGLLTPGSAT